MTAKAIRSTRAKLERIRRDVNRIESELLAVTGNTKGMESDEFKRLAAVRSAVALRCGLSVADFASVSRKQSVCWPRQVAMALCREFTGLSLQRIGAAFGGRETGTVVCAVRTLQSRSETETRTKAVVSQIREEIQNNLKKIFTSNIDENINKSA